MSKELRTLASRLTKLAKLPRRDIRGILKTAPRRLVKVLSEIAFNTKEGVLKISNRIKNSKVVKVLADKTAKLKEKRAVLCTVGAPIVIQAIITAAFEVLKRLNG